jgi:hypothetical protein
MRVIGLMCAWACEDWINPAIENHLRICDEIYVNISAHHHLFNKFRDKTRLYANKKWEGNKDVKLMEGSGVNKRDDVAGVAKARILNRMIYESHAKPGDILMICDTDEFYNLKAVAELMRLFKQHDWEMLSVRDMMFVLKGNWYVLTEHNRFFRFDKGFYFLPTQRPVPAPAVKRIVLNDCPMYHYSMLVPMEYRKVFWQMDLACTNRSKLKSRLDWIDRIYLKWEPDNLVKCRALARKNQDITGNYGFWFHGEVKEKPEPPYLFEYSGEHFINVS